MTVPNVADTSDTIDISCRFDMETEELYAVKWYKDDQEFFRYMPLQQPHIITFPVSGVHLDLVNSNCELTYCQLRLAKLTRYHTDGAYRCEISSEAPTFRLAASTHNISIASLPKEKLKMIGVENVYIEGDSITATCISSPSDPIAVITWFINNEEVPVELIEDSKASDDNGLVFRSTMLRFQASRKYAQDNSDRIEIRCVSILPGIPLTPQEATHLIFIKSRTPHTISNEKLHWFNSSTSKPGLCSFIFVFLLFK